MGCIYCARSPSNKVYIGLTTRTLAYRRAAHHQNYKKFIKTGRTYNHYLMNAFKKYGFEAFNWTILAEAEKIEDLNKLEQLYIEEYKSTNHEFGYNIKKGGEASKIDDATKKRMSAIRLEPERNKQIREGLKVSHGKGSEVALKTSKRNKVRWQDPEYKRFMQQQNYIKVVDGSGSIWNSIQECADAYGVHRKLIDDSISRRRTPNKGGFSLIVRHYNSENDIKQAIDEQNKFKCIKIYDKHYMSVRDASRSLGVSDYFIRKHIADGNAILIDAIEMWINIRNNISQNNNRSRNEAK